MNEKRNLWLPIALMAAFAVTRWPGLLPPNFSAAYALVFCAGVYIPKRYWWLPTATLLITDVALNVYYSIQFGMNTFKLTMLANYAAYALGYGLGRRFGPGASFGKLLGGGLASALVFYVVTNCIAWLFNPFSNPEYTRDLPGLLTALFKGTAGYMATWEFFKNTLFSGGLFTALFVGAMKLTADAESPKEKDPGTAPDQTSEDPVPEEATA